MAANFGNLNHSTGLQFDFRFVICAHKLVELDYFELFFISTHIYYLPIFLRNFASMFVWRFVCVSVCEQCDNSWVIRPIDTEFCQSLCYEKGCLLFGWGGIIGDGSKSKISVIYFDCLNFLDITARVSKKEAHQIGNAHGSPAVLFKTRYQFW